METSVAKSRRLLRVSPTQESGSGRSWPLWGGLAVCGGLLIAVRLHAFALPLETDECNYAYIGARLLAGDRLYVDVWDHQPPGVFVLFAGVISLFGDAPDVFRWMATAFSLGSLVLIFTLLRRLSTATVALVGACLFALCAADPGTAGEGCNREIYMSTLILLAWYCAIRGRVSPPTRAAPPAGIVLQRDTSSPAYGWLLASGSALALASIIKTVVAVHWVVLALWIAIEAWVADRARARGADNVRDTARPEARGSEEAGDIAPARPSRLPVRCTQTGLAAARTVGVGSRRRPLWPVIRSLAWFSAGPLILWVGTFGYFALTGRLAAFVDAVFLFNLSYSGGSGRFADRFLQFFTPARHPFLFDSAWPLWIGAIAASLWLIGAALARKDRDALALLLLILGSYLAVCLPGRFWPHYYYLLIPSVIPAVAFALGRLVTRLSEFVGTRSPGWSAAPAVIYAVLPIGVMVTEYRDYLSQPLFGITVKRYNSRDFWGRAQGENVRRVTDPDDEVFVFGNDTEIYYYARRRCASRFTMITGLQSAFDGSDRRRRTLIDELRARPPRLILVLFDEPPFPAWKDFLAEYYGEPIGWDFHDRTGEPIMFVVARKGRPVEPINWDWDRSTVGGWMLGER